LLYHIFYRHCQLVSKTKTKHIIKLAVLRRSVKQVCDDFFRDQGNTTTWVDVEVVAKPLATLYKIWPAWDLNSLD